MDYKIIETHITFSDNKIDTIAVLWESNPAGWVRATYCTTTPCSGYKFLMPNEIISPELIQEVAAAGFNLPEEKKKQFFPKNYRWER